MNSIQCIKTGCQARKGHEYLYGDLFRVPNYGYLFRIVHVGEPVRNVVHCEITSYDLWFGEHQTAQEKPSTLLIVGPDLSAFSYVGVPIDGKEEANA